MPGERWVASPRLGSCEESAGDGPGSSNYEPTIWSQRQLVPLFRGESDRYQRLLASIRNTLESLTEIRVAWLDAPPARPGEPLHIGVVGESGSLAWLSDEIRSRIAEVGARL